MCKIEKKITSIKSLGNPWFWFVRICAIHVECAVLPSQKLTGSSNVIQEWDSCLSCLLFQLYLTFQVFLYIKMFALCFIFKELLLLITAYSMFLKSAIFYTRETILYSCCIDLIIYKRER